MRSIAADDRLRRQAIKEAANVKLEAVNRQEAQLSARRAALVDRSSVPFIGTYEDNIMCKFQFPSSLKRLGPSY